MISVVLVTFNSMDVLPDCLDSLERCSSAKDLEIIIVDNASTDSTADWSEQYAARRKELPYRNIQVLTMSENRGYAYASNRGLEVAGGEFLLLLNPDTLVGELAVERCRQSLMHDSSMGAVGCRLELADGTIDRACRRSFPTPWNSFARLSGLSLVFPRSRWLASYNLTFLDEFASYPVDCLCGAFLMVPRQVYESVGGLDEAFFMYGEDIDWCYRIKKSGYLIWYDGSVTTIHFKGGNGGKRSRESLRHFYDTMYLYYVKTLGNERESMGAIMLRLLLRMLFVLHAVAKRVS